MNFNRFKNPISFTRTNDSRYNYYKSQSIGLLERLFAGTAPSDCPLPCTTFSTETRRISYVDGYLGFGVTFENIVEVENKVHYQLQKKLFTFRYSLHYIQKVFKMFTQPGVSQYVIDYNYCSINARVAEFIKIIIMFVVGLY